jgi:hypothetical protein
MCLGKAHVGVQGYMYMYTYNLWARLALVINSI